MLLIGATFLAAAFFLVLKPPSSMTVHADFAQADGMHIGSDAGILGVRMGKVVDIQPMGDRVRLTMTVPADTKIPANAQAVVMSPTVVSDQYVEFTPAFRGGPALADGAIIPVERTRSPVKWDKLVFSVNEMLVTFGPQGANADGSIGRVLDSSARLLEGKGKKFRDAILDVSQASEVVNGELGNVEGLLRNLDKLVQILSDNKDTVDRLITSVDSVASAFSSQERNIVDAIGSLSSVMDQVSQLAKEHGPTMTKSVKRLADVSIDLAKHQNQLVEILDVLPLGSENVARAVTPEGKLRVRLNHSINLEQFDAFKQLCQAVQLPLCSGTGITPPLPFPPELPGLPGLPGVSELPDVGSNLPDLNLPKLPLGGGR